MNRLGIALWFFAAFGVIGCATIPPPATTITVDGVAYTVESMTTYCRAMHANGVPDDAAGSCAQLRDQNIREQSRIEQVQQDRRERAAAALQAFGQGMSQRSLNCTSSRIGNTVFTNCN